ncbi:MAG: hypothetical protein KatS3mg096_699 [Candidatus Parcubacteria bacterium]|nr:MAG: hypothetical protein KatS3mg096_672 [Candidatus Parcubacteria bacterium]GIW67831.1 MAG: hypothetical protein KatS3mg096_699 [Candidatus Parcubacteria bacterium]
MVYIEIIILIAILLFIIIFMILREIFNKIDERRFIKKYGEEGIGAAREGALKTERRK